MAQHTIGNHDKDLLYELFTKYGQREWVKITHEYNQIMPGILDKETGEVRLWTKKELTDKKKNYKFHGQWPTMKTPHNNSSNSEAASSTPQLLDDQNGGPSKKVKLNDEISIIQEDHTIHQRYVSISIFSYFSV